MGSRVRIERIISHGQTTPEGEWYDQEDDEWVVLLQGEATLEWEDGETTQLAAGDALALADEVDFGGQATLWGRSPCSFPMCAAAGWSTPACSAKSA